MNTRQGSKIIEGWPEESREAAQLVIDKYGEPDEATESFLIWNQAGPWKRIIASKAFFKHDFPVPHFDSVESVLDYRVPPQYFTPLAEFDGSVMVDRTVGEVSARCHDEEANSLALNLTHDIATGKRTVEEARQYYAKEFLDYRRRQPTPYMDELRFETGGDTADADGRVVSDDEIQRALEEGKAAGRRAG